MSTTFKKFGVYDAICWKMLPKKVGCGVDYVWDFKFAYIQYNKEVIRKCATANGISPLLLAGIALVEVGGKDFTDWPVYYLRSLDWMGPAWVDTNLTVTKKPFYTSMGAVSIQLRRAAETLGFNPHTMTSLEMDALAHSLQFDEVNLAIVAKHLKQLMDIDFASKYSCLNLTDEQLAITATRYYYGPEKSTEFIKSESVKSNSHGSRILQRKQKILDVLQ